MSNLNDLISKIDSPTDIKKMSNSELQELGKEVRNFLIESVAKTGGHLASNLGVVELTIAIHRVFNSPKDKIIWDVGHQAYVHKLFTGRKHLFHTLRKHKGMSGFPKRCESEHDVFETGHSSTSISAGLGMAKARDILGEKHAVVSIIGDGALTGGMAFEALNHAGHSNTDFIVILNDNAMSISQNVGGLSKYLNRLRSDPTYFKVKNDVENLLNKIPAVGKAMFKTAEKAKDSLKYFLVPGVIFEELGFTYLGPVNGHDLKELTIVLNRAKNINGPVFIHVLTKKGKGYDFAEKNPDKFHGVNPFKVETGKAVSVHSSESYSAVFGQTLCKLAQKNRQIVGITAAMPSGTGLSEFANKYPERFFDVGIAEQHAVTFAAGLAAKGLRPVFAVYSTFLQRAYDQIIHDVCLQNLSVLFCIDRGGLVGNDGETHHGVFDLSFLSHIPNMMIMAPKDGKELKSMMEFAFTHEGPIAIRYPRGESDDFSGVSSDYNVASLQAEILMKGNDICIFAIGNMVRTAYEAALRLKAENINCTVVNARFAKPLDEARILSEASACPHVITLEDNLIKGGFGSQVLDLLNKKNVYKNIKLLGLPDQFIEHGDNDDLFKLYGLDVDGVVSHAYEMLGK
ncbi:1-deoxy-D-xylulose-5-phosphate synthase [Anaerosolibacter carboniphilus]|uniref:1-deoxy-D-xylulose-5-phosphate synthase n=1 Tax=Anaerosolibacter carboniphilus TaxID=1417629 RepID=A0A841KSS5_9FIRM|nr:1-deoxy-D-xylulose-5-phosphate synthase [Anaerosolibacter carboniphilus]MBB6216636.1 1-deoxy-D-xylulose-5-phosphate synthase [Anaerosolibacter carboniphilus]